MNSRIHHIVLFLIAVISLALSLRPIHIQTRALNSNRQRFKRLHQSNDEGSENPYQSKKGKSENIGLFAAGDRKAPVLPTTPSSTALDAPITTTPESILEEASVHVTASASRSTTIELQAELLRLEAEKEQLEIDQQRIEAEQRRLEEIDKLILKITEGGDLEKLIVSNRVLVRKELFFRLAELANAAIRSEERNRYATLADDLMDAAMKIDPALHAELSADIQKELNNELNRLRAGQKMKDAENVKVYDQVLQQWIQQTMNGSSSVNVSAFPIITDPAAMNMLLMNGSNPIPLGGNMGGGAMIRFPSALPINLLPMMLRSPEISKEDLTILKETIFTADIMDNANVDYATFLVTIRGKPTESIESTYEEAKRRISNVPGMDDRVTLFLLPEYRVIEQKNEAIEKYSGLNYEPVFTILSKTATPRPMGQGEYAFSILSLILAVGTSFIYSVDINSLNSAFLQQAIAAASASNNAIDGTVPVEVLNTARDVVNRVVPVTGGLIGLQLVHDIGHYIMGSIYKTKLSWPYFFPSLQIGLFGSVTSFLSFPKTRKELFDVSIAGPTLGFIASLGVTLVGLAATASASPEIAATFPALPTGFFSASLLLHELADNFLHLPQTITPTSVTPIHPLVAVGMIGLLTNAFNFLPVGRLDGGRVAMSIAGRQAASSIAFATLIAQGLNFFSNSSPIALFWILIVVFLQRGQDIPPIDDVTPVATIRDDENKSPVWFARALALLFCVGMTAATILQVPAPLDLVPGLGGGGGDAVQTGVSALQGLPGIGFPNKLDI